MEKTFLNQCQNEIDTKFTPKKLRSKILADSYFRLQMYSKSQTVLGCADTIEYRKYENEENAKLSNVWFCKNRLCPLCAWRRSLKLYGQLSSVMDNLEGSFRFVFVTLSIKNVYGDELCKTISLLNKAFFRLMHYKEMNFVKGYFKALEITHDSYEYISKKMWYGNKKQHIKARGRYYSKMGLHIGDKNPNFDKYHPHFHCIFAVPDDYFDNSNFTYLSQSRLCELWQKALKLDYLPVCDIRPVKPQVGKNDGIMGFKGAVCEVGKYSVKDTDYLTGNEEFIDKTVKTLTSALNHSRLCSWGGVFEDVRKLLKLADKDPIDGDLVHINDENVEIRQDLSYIIIRYNWNVGVGYEREIEQHVNIDVEVDSVE